jgi:hypothetical protein
MDLLICQDLPRQSLTSNLIQTTELIKSISDEKEEIDFNKIFLKEEITNLRSWRFMRLFMTGLYITRH